MFSSVLEQRMGPIGGQVAQLLQKSERFIEKLQFKQAPETWTKRNLIEPIKSMIGSDLSTAEVNFESKCPQYKIDADTLMVS